jgi:hypothetical protein
MVRHDKAIVVSHNFMNAPKNRHALPIFPPEWSLSNLNGIHDSVFFQLVKCTHYSHFSLRRKIANAGYIPTEK